MSASKPINALGHFLAQAFQSLVRPLLGQSEAELGRWLDALSDALGPNGQLIVLSCSRRTRFD